MTERAAVTVRQLTIWLLIMIVCGMQHPGAADETGGMGQPVRLPPGASDHRREYLRLVRDLREGQTADAVVRIPELLADVTDDAIADPESGRVTSLRAAVVAALAELTPGQLRAWRLQAEPAAAAELRAAVFSSNRSAPGSVLRKYPLTDSACRAGCLAVVQALAEGDFAVAGIIVRQLRREFTSRSASAESVALVRNVADRLAASQAADELQTDPGHTVVPWPDGRSAADAQSIAWPRPVWMHRDSVWESPEAAPHLFDTVGNRAADSSGWQAVPQGELVWRRTLRGMQAFERSTGSRVFEVRVTVSPPVNQSLPAGRRNVGGFGIRNQGIRGLSGDVSDGGLHHRMAAQFNGDTGSLVVTDGDLVVFADAPLRLRNPGDSPEAASGVLQRMASARNPQWQATRLVAFRVTSDSGQLQPAWLIGDPEGASYYVTDADGRMTEFSGDDFPLYPSSEHGAGSRIASESQRPGVGAEPTGEEPALPGRPLTSQSETPEYFTGLPVLHGQRLFWTSVIGERVEVSCMRCSDGTLLWRRPVGWNSANSPSSVRNMFTVGESVTPGGSDMCTVVGDSVVCTLASGTVVSVSIPDGSLRWFTDLSVEQGAVLDWRIGRRQLLQLSRSHHARRFPEFRPVIEGESLFWKAPGSEQIVRLDLATGEIRWSVSSVPLLVTAGTAEGDTFALGIRDGALLLAGEHHCRSLRVSDGLQSWVTALPPLRGQGIMCDGWCFLPTQAHGTVVLDAGSGRVVPAMHSVPELPQSCSLSCDREFLYVSRCDFIAAYPWLGTVADRLAASLRSEDFEEEQNDVARLMNEYRQVSAVLQLLRGMRGSTSPGRAVGIEAGLQQLIAGREDDSPTETSAEQRLRIAQLLAQGPGDELPLRVRFQAAAVLPDSVARMPRLLPVASDFESTAKLPMIPVASFLKVRADVAMVSAALSSETDRLPGIRDWRNAALMPQLFSVEELLAEIDRLRRRREPGAAALLAESAAALHPHRPEAVSDILNEIRSRTRSGVLHLPDQRPVSGPAAGDAIRGAGASREIVTADADRYAFSDRFSELIDVFSRSSRNQITEPGWLPGRILMRNSADGTMALTVIDGAAAAVADTTEIPGGLSWTLLPDRNLQSSTVLPVSGPFAYGMISMIGSDGPQLLWSRRNDVHESVEATPLLVTPGVTVWQHDTHIFGVETANGRLLWTRSDMPFDEKAASLNAVQITGDLQYCALLAPDCSRYAVISVTDGRLLHSGSTDTASGTFPVFSGMRMLYRNGAGMLRLLNLRTKAEYSPAVRLPENPGVRAAHVFSGDRAAVLSRSGEVVLLDLTDGTILNTIAPRDQRAADTAVFGLQVIERPDRLLLNIALPDRRDRLVTAGSRVGEDTIAAGRLICLDPETLDEVWDIPVDAGVAPRVYGDDSGQLLLWSFRASGLSDELFPIRRIGDAEEKRELIVKLFSMRTGELLGEPVFVQSGEPVLCSFTADDRSYDVRTEHMHIRLRLTELR